MNLIRGLLAGVFLVWAGLSAHAAPDSKLRVVTTTAILADMVANVGMDLVEVDCLVPPGANLHNFSPTPGDMARLTAADLIVVNGLGLEGWLEETIAHSGTEAPIVVASKSVEPLEAAHHHAHHDHDHDHDHHHAIDPHAWMDVRRGMSYVEGIRDALAEADPAHASDYAAWADAYLAQLRVLDAWIRREVSAIPRERRVLITDHDAFRYFAEAYEFDSMSLTGTHMLTEASAKTLAEAVERMESQGVHVVFVESSGNRKVVQQIANEAGGRLGGELLVSGPATSDEPFSYARLHLTNVRLMVRCLK